MTKNKNILKISNIVEDFGVGGIQRMLLNYLHFFRNSISIDYCVIVLGHDLNRGYEKICKENNYKITFLRISPSKAKNKYIRKLSNIWRYNSRFFFSVLKHKPDVIHTHNTRILFKIYHSIILFKKRYVFCHTLHSDPFAIGDGEAKYAKKLFNKYGVKPICLNNTQFYKAKERYSISNCFILYNPFDKRLIEKQKTNGDNIRKKYNITQNAYVIGSLGRFETVKNYDFLVDVFSEVLKIKRNAVLLICGPGNKDYIYKKTKLLNIYDKVVLLDESLDIKNIFNTINVYVLCSLSEASPYSLLEAQSYNKTSIVSTGIPVESICTNHVVRLSLNDSLDNWAHEIAYPKSFSKRFSNLEDYDIETTSKKMIDTYRGFLQ